MSHHGSVPENESATVSRFRSFWSGQKNVQKQDKPFKFINFGGKSPEEDPDDSPPATKNANVKGVRGKLAKLLHDSDTSKEDGPARRRTQLSDAQKRHKQRKADYITNLEQEIAKLRQTTSTIDREIGGLRQERQKLLSDLESSGISIHDSHDDFEAATLAGNLLANVRVQHDPVVNRERTFVSAYTTHQLAGSPSDVEIQAERITYAALDFILALEHPCRDHVIYPDQHLESGTNATGHNHLMTMTQSVLNYCQMIPQLPLAENVALPQGALAVTDWTITYHEIERLLDLSDLLDLPLGVVTPAQIYRFVRNTRQHIMLETLEYLKVKIGSLTKCFEFGSYIETDIVLKAIEDMPFS